MVTNDLASYLCPTYTSIAPVYGRLEALIANMNQVFCPCGSPSCPGFLVTETLIGLMEKLQPDINRKLNIFYMFKCAAYNNSIGGGNNMHASGLAIDVNTVATGINPEVLAQLAWDVGFNGVGVYGSNTQVGYKNKMGMVHLGIERFDKFWGDWQPKHLDI